MTLKSGTKTEDMVSILEDLHPYVPTTSRDLQLSVEISGQDEHLTVTVDDFHYTVLGDNLYNYTVCRM